MCRTAVQIASYSRESSPIIRKYVPGDAPTPFPFAPTKLSNLPAFFPPSYSSSNFFTAGAFIPITFTTSAHDSSLSSSLMSPLARSAARTPSRVCARPFLMSSSGRTKYRYGFATKTTRGCSRSGVVPGCDRSSPIRGELYTTGFDSGAPERSDAPTAGWGRRLR